MLNPLLIRLRRFDIVLREKHLDLGHACEGQYIVGHRLSVSRRKLLVLAGLDFADLLGFQRLLLHTSNDRYLELAGCVQHANECEQLGELNVRHEVVASPPRRASRP
jgi:hypothetical protein